MRGHKLKIGEMNFSTKKSAIEFYRNILSKYEANTSVSDEDYSYLIDLLNYNSDASEENNLENEDGGLPI